MRNTCAEIAALFVVNLGSFYLVRVLIVSMTVMSQPAHDAGLPCAVPQVMSRGAKMETLEDQAGILRDEVSGQITLLLSTYPTYLVSVE